MGFGSKCSILNGQVIYLEKSKSNIANMWLIPLDHVTFVIMNLLAAQNYHHNIFAISPYLLMIFLLSSFLQAFKKVDQTKKQAELDKMKAKYGLSTPEINKWWW